MDAAGGGGVEGRSAILGNRNYERSSAEMLRSGYSKELSVYASKDQRVRLVVPSSMIIAPI